MLWQKATFDDEEKSFRSYLSRARPYWKETVIVILAALNLLNWTKWYYRGVEEKVVGLGMDESFSTQLPWRKRTPYHSISDEDKDTVDAAWDAIIPDHGIVALDRIWAEKRGLMRSMYLPSNPEKVLYVLEAYHQLHCLTTTRKAFFNLIDREPLDRSLEHYNHCFDAILQTIVCTPSTNLLYTFGHREVNQTQMRQCRNWAALRDWATQHTACDASDTNGLNNVFHQDFCHGGSDGLIVP